MKNNYSSPLAFSIPIGGLFDLNSLDATGLSNGFIERSKYTLRGDNVLWGMPFNIDKVHVIHREPITITCQAFEARWVCFLHTAELTPELSSSLSAGTLGDLAGCNQSTAGYLNQLAAQYYLLFDDGSEYCYEIRYRHRINTASPEWGENCFQAVPQYPPFVKTHQENLTQDWGVDRRVNHSGENKYPDKANRNWICALENPCVEKKIVGIRVEPGAGIVILSAVTGCNTVQTPIRWSAREKMLLDVSNLGAADLGDRFRNIWGANDYQSSYMYLTEQRQSLLGIDMGDIISVVPRKSYPNADWSNSDFNSTGNLSDKEYLIEYTAHPEAKFYSTNGYSIAVQELKKLGAYLDMRVVPNERKVVTLSVVDKTSRQPVAVRLHIHGEFDEYLAPVNRQRIPSGAFFEDYSPELAGPEMHTSTYIDGVTKLKLPLGTVYIEVSKGFEFQPVRKSISITEETNDILIEIERVLNWRREGWVTADTHVHFLSPATAHLEGAAEGVNVVNLLASQWGELMTNVGDFDGKTTYRNSESGDQYLVRVGTENRQNVLGHISLLGYSGPMITPLCSGGVHESALGDPVEVLMSEWAQRCKEQGGLVVAPHFPEPRAEHAATIVSGLIDAVEMNGFRKGVPPAALVNWYQYLSCGYQIPLSAGTDKQFSCVEIGQIRTYSKLLANSITDIECSYQDWMDSIKGGNTFVTVGPLVEFSVNGLGAGSRLLLDKTGGKITVTWMTETIKYTISAVELVVNGEVVDGKNIEGNKGSGYFEVPVSRSSWMCLLVRGTMTGDDKERILAHTSSIMIEVSGSDFFSAPDAVSILEQIEGSIAYLEHIGTRAETVRFNAMRLILEQSYKLLHDKLHQQGFTHMHGIDRSHH